MSQQLDFSRLYLLLHAFHLLGQHLHGSDWTGTEPWARPSRLKEAQEEGGRLSAELKALRDDIAALEDEMRDAIGREESEVVSARLHERRQAQRQLRERAQSVPDLTGSYLTDQAAYERRQKTEETFLAGLRDGALQLRFGTDQMIHWPTWREHPDFRLSFELSMARAPRTLSSRRRAPVFVDRAPFASWLEAVMPLTESALQVVSPEQRCIAYLKAEVAKGNRLSKPEHWSMAKERVSGLSKRAFDRVWNSVVPEEWKQAGRRKRAPKGTTPS